MNTASRSKMSTSGSVTSPWTSSGIPIACIRSSAGSQIGDVGHAVGRAGGRVGGIELGGGEHPFRMPARQIVRIGVIGEVGGHQRREVGPLGQRGEDPLAIGSRAGRVGHRRRQVGHHDRAGELGAR